MRSFLAMYWVEGVYVTFSASVFLTKGKWSLSLSIKWQEESYSSPSLLLKFICDDETSAL